MEVLLHSWDYINCSHVLSLAFFVEGKEMGTQHGCMSHKHLSLSVSYLINRSLQPFRPVFILGPPNSMSSFVLHRLSRGDKFSPLLLYLKVFIFQA